MVDFLDTLPSAQIEGARYTYRVDERGSACIEQCKATCSHLRIPEAIDGFPVTAIGDSAFAKLSSVENVVCPCQLRHIGRHAFEGCLHLRSIALNEGLVSVGEGAFFLCGALGQLNVPASVERFGPRPLGSSTLPAFGKQSPFEVRFAPDGNHLFFDSSGVLYERREDGLVLVDAYRFEGEVLECDAATMEIGPRALSSMPHLREVVLPEGLRRIGDEAFRGCTGLSRINLPSSLESIGNAAFSCTALESLRLPASCTRISASAFAFGPIASDGTARPYQSALCEISVEDGNEAFCMSGALLCERVEDGALQAVLAPSTCKEVEIGGPIALVRDTAFAGTRFIGKLRIADGARFESEQGIGRTCAIESVEVVFSGSENHETAVRLPHSGKGSSSLSRAFSNGIFDARAFFRAYDAELSAIENGFEQMKLIVERLAHPACIDEKAASSFRHHVESQLAVACAALGERGEFSLIELMADEGLLDERRIEQAIEGLSHQDCTQTTGYLLDMRKRRFSAASWDEYAL